jgi:hypothetical protein
MRREISSNTQTAFIKLIYPLFGGLILLFIMFGIIFDKQDRIGGIILFTVFSVLAFFIIRWAFRLKNVELDKDGIFVSHTHFAPKKEIFVPFDNIKCVSQSFWQCLGNPETVKIEFTEENEFGKEIKFIPKIRFFPLLEHPIVDELNQIINQYKLENFDSK